MKKIVLCFLFSINLLYCDDLILNFGGHTSIIMENGQAEYKRIDKASGKEYSDKDNSWYSDFDFGNSIELSYLKKVKDNIHMGVGAVYIEKAFTDEELPRIRSMKSLAIPLVIRIEGVDRKTHNLNVFYTLKTGPIIALDKDIDERMELKYGNIGFYSSITGGIEIYRIQFEIGIFQGWNYGLKYRETISDDKSITFMKDDISYTNLAYPFLFAKIGYRFSM